MADADALGPAGFPFPAALPLAAAGGLFLVSVAPAAASAPELSMARWWGRIGQGARVWGGLGTKFGEREEARSQSLSKANWVWALGTLARILSVVQDAHQKMDGRDKSPLKKDGILVRI